MTGEDWWANLEDLADEQVRRANGEEPDENGRHVRFTPASEIPIARTRWLWHERLAVGTFALLAGREGLGKSTVGYWLAARVTRGEIPGEFIGTPRGVLICATEDTYAEVIVPRLIAAGADLERVFRVDVLTASGATDLSLPVDLDAVGKAALRLNAALLLLDPLISRLGRADTHRDSETRKALEPLAALAGTTGMAVLGLIHHNKSAGADVLTQIMGSRAFTAVARSVHTVVEDPDDDDRNRLLFGTTKNNLGPSTSLPTLTFVIESAVVGVDSIDGTEVIGSRVLWGEDSTTAIAEAYSASREGAGGQMGEAVRLLRDLLDHSGGSVTSKQAKQAAHSEGVSEATLKRAARNMRLVIESSGWPRTTTWSDPDTLPSRKDEREDFGR